MNILFSNIYFNGIFAILSEWNEPIYIELLWGTATVGNPKIVFEYSYLLICIKSSFDNSITEKGSEQTVMLIQFGESPRLWFNSVTKILLLSIVILSGLLI